MKFLLNKLTLVFIILSSLISAANTYGVTVDRILATIGEEVITFTDYQQFVKGIGDIENKNVVDENLLKRLIEEKIILQEAKRKGIEAADTEIDRTVEEFKAQNGLSQEDLEKFLKEEDMSIDRYRKILRDKIMLSKLLNIEVDSKVIIKDKEIEDFYNKNKNDFLITPEKVEINAIFLRLKEGASVTEITDLKRRALKIVALLQGGDNFERLVDEYSDEPLKSQRGILGNFVKGALIPPLDNKAFSMKKEEISEPIWVKEGVYILQLINKSSEGFKTFEEVKGKIHNYLYEQKREKLFNEWIKTLWERSSVTTNQS